jgi:PhzF family phenazine biosynthesis protein
MTTPSVDELRAVRVRVVDAFTDEAFSGNPAGVVLLESRDWPTDDRMRLIASELGHETAFARPLPEGRDADWELRWFTPGSESNVCGHATLATLHALRSDAGRGLSVRFDSSYGILHARADADGPITLDFPAAVLAAADVPPGLAAALGIELDLAVTTGVLGDLLVMARDEATVQEMRPGTSAGARVIKENGLRGIIVTASANATNGPYDIVSRFFSPATGVAEDPVTGSAHTALAPFWSERLGRDRLVGLQASERPGLVGMLVLEDRIELSGSAVTVLDGILTLA